MKNSNIHANTAPKKKIRGLKRKLIQIAAFGFTNSHIPNFMSGRLYTGKWKEFCVPGLNCYSCPAATFACPIGALQAVTGNRKFPISFYVFGLLLAFGVIFGRAVCGFLLYCRSFSRWGLPVSLHFASTSARSELWKEEFRLFSHSRRSGLCSDLSSPGK